jgi:hypothetical protein
MPKYRGSGLGVSKHFITEETPKCEMSKPKCKMPKYRGSGLGVSKHFITEVLAKARNAEKKTVVCSSNGAG